MFSELIPVELTNETLQASHLKTFLVPLQWRISLWNRSSAQHYRSEKVYSVSFCPNPTYSESLQSKKGRKKKKLSSHILESYCRSFFLRLPAAQVPTQSAQFLTIFGHKPSLLRSNHHPLHTSYKITLLLCVGSTSPAWVCGNGELTQELLC